MTDYKQQFFSLLHNSFYGSKMTSNKGRLAQFKNQYFNNIKEKIDSLCKEYAKEDNDFYDKIYHFFSSYINETGTPFFCSSKIFHNEYARIFNNKEDVSLFYKTRDLYYVKSERIFSKEGQSVAFKCNNDGKEYVIFFDESNVVEKATNVKDELVYEKIDEKNLKVYYKSDFKTLFEKNPEKIMEEHLLEAIARYKKQSECDFFIHKNAYNFFEERFKSYIMNFFWNETEFSEGNIKRMQNLRRVVLQIAGYIHNFENELKKLWEKPKIAHSCNYVISLSKLNDETRKFVLDNLPQGQKEEWEALGMVRDGELFTATHLPIDTKHFTKEAKYKILASIENIEKQTDGTLIKSDNWQALKTLQRKHANKVDLIYIDPPFNTGSDFAYKDGFQDSTWLTLMQNRLELAHNLLSARGSFYLHLDHNANHYGRILMNDTFGEENFVNEIVWCYNEGANSKKYFNRKHDNIIFYTKILNNYLFNNNDILEEYSEGNVKKYKYEDEIGKYRIMGRGIQSSQFCSKRDLSPTIEKEYPELVYRHYLGDGKLPTDFWILDIINQASNERIGFNTQKPEKLLERIINASSNKSESTVMDFFSGSGTTIATAHKLGRKWIGVEMGEHFYDVIIPRMKEVLAQKGNHEPCGISKTCGFEGGGMFKYYELEQYQETLEKAHYDFDGEKINLQKSEFLLEQGLNLDGKIPMLTLERLFENVDIIECFANITGWEIERIHSPTLVDFKEQKGIDFSTTNLADFENLIEYLYLKD